MGLSSAYSFVQTTQGFVGLSSYERKMITKIDRFTADGTFTPPAGVTYAVAHIRAGGGGAGGSTAGGAGGNSSVAFASGTITATGGNGGIALGSPPTSVSGTSRPANSGLGAFTASDQSVAASSAADGAYIVAGGAVTPSIGITVTVGAGGTAGAGGGQAGGSGYVWIEYQVPA